MPPRTLFAAALIALAALPSAQADQRCVDFLAFPDNTPLAEKFKLAKFKFHDRSGGWAPFVNVFTDIVGQPVHGMQFDHRVLRITPPDPSMTVELRIGAFAPFGLKLDALDAAGRYQDVLILPGDDIMHAVTLTAVSAPITMVQVTGGGNEGVLNGVCATR